MTRRQDDEIWERFAEVEGDILALTTVLLHHIAECDFTIRHHAAGLLNSLEKHRATVPKVPPNDRMLLRLADLMQRIENIRASREAAIDD